MTQRKQVVAPHRLAEGVGFEPTEACASRAFQARRFGRSRTPPNLHGAASGVWTSAGYLRSSLSRTLRQLARVSISLWGAVASPSEVTVGSCATDARESGQVRKEAAFIGSTRVPQMA